MRPSIKSIKDLSIFLSNLLRESSLAVFLILWIAWAETFPIGLSQWDGALKILLISIPIHHHPYDGCSERKPDRERTATPVITVGKGSSFAVLGKALWTPLLVKK